MNCGCAGHALVVTTLSWTLLDDTYLGSTLLQRTLESIEIWPICKAGYNEVLKLMTAWPVPTSIQASRLPVKVLLSAHMYALGTS